jgi:hypothetical protein
VKKLSIIVAAAVALLATAAVAQVTGSAQVLLSTLSNTAQVVKAAAGKLQWLSCGNPNASIAYVQIFDAASATSVTVGTTSPKSVFTIAASSSTHIRPEASFLNGIKAAATTGPTNGTAPGSAVVCSFGVN